MFSNSREVHYICIGGVFVFSGLATFATVDGLAADKPFLAGLSLHVFSLICLWLYLRSGILKYKITDDALVIKRPLGSQVVPWTEITEIKWNQIMHTITFHGSGGVIAFASTDFFPLLQVLVNQVWSRSSCKVSVQIREVLTLRNDMPNMRWPGGMYFAWNSKK